MTATEPIVVAYCPHCSFPPDLCAWGPCYEASCKAWLAVHHPHLLPAAAPAVAAGGGPASAGAGGDAAAAELAALSLSSSSGGAAAPAPAPAPKAVSFGVKGKKGGAAACAITVTRKDRGRGKCVTIIKGLETFDVKLKEAASALGKKYGTGGTVTKDATGGQEVTIQGDFAAEMPEVLEALYKVPAAAVYVAGD